MTLAAGTVIVLVARSDSTRLPGKALLKLGSRTIVAHIIARLERLHQPIVLATTTRAIDDELADHGEDLRVGVHRGPVHDVARRVVSAAEQGGAEWFVRANADSPFPAPDLLEMAGSLQTTEVDLVSNVPGRSFPYGVSVEIVRVSSLRERLAAMTPSQREHVTEAFYAGDAQRMAHITSSHPSLKRARLTIDTMEDLKAMRRVVDSLDDSTTASWTEIAALALRLERTRGSC